MAQPSMHGMACMHTYMRDSDSDSDNLWLPWCTSMQSPAELHGSLCVCGGCSYVQSCCSCGNAIKQGQGSSRQDL